MCAEGQQLQYGNCVLQLCLVQRKVLLLVCVALCVAYVIKNGGETRRQHVVPRQGRGKKREGRMGVLG